MAVGSIAVAADGRGFGDSRGAPFVVWGLNYDRSYHRGSDVLLEELIEQAPGKLAEDFARARELGANVLRLFLQHARYQPRLGEIDAAALDRLDLAIATARRQDLRVDLTGLSHIDSEVVAEWYRIASDEEIVTAEALFWEKIAERYAGEPTIFCYDLQNEPYVNWHDSYLITIGSFPVAGHRRFSYCNAHLKEVRARWGAWVRSRYESAAAMLPAWVTLIPLYILYSRLGWINTYLPWLVPAALGGGAFNIFLLRQFMLTIPEELTDAAKVDGCGHLRIWGNIMLSLGGPVLATVAVFTFVLHWNDFFGPMILLNDDRLYPLQVGLWSFQTQYGANYPYMMAVATVVMIPVLVVFFVAQRYLVEGITLTGLKG